MGRKYVGSRSQQPQATCHRHQPPFAQRPTSIWRSRRPQQNMSAHPSMDCVMVAVHLDEVQQEEVLMDCATRMARQRIYLALLGEPAWAAPTTATLDLLARCFDSSARLSPKLDVVPLFPSLGWTLGQLAALKDVERVLASSQHAEECCSLAARISEARAPLQLPSLALTLVPFQPPAPMTELSPLAATEARILGKWEGPLRFGTVAVGGTFDRLHAGHRLLLAATALVATRSIFVGVTAEHMLAVKKNRNLLQSYAAREAAAVQYMQRINPSVEVTAGPLCDPKDPPLCATELGFDAIVVSEETIHGADAINAVRAGLGFPPLVVVVVGLVTSARTDVKLSSTDLRAIEAGGVPRG